MIARGLGIFCCSIAVWTLGCGDDDPTVLDGNDPDAGLEEDAGPGEPVVPELDGSWTKVEPGGDTICARGDDFHFFVRGGSVNKLAIVFDGGGACWDAVTCGLADQIFSPIADETLPEPGEGIGDNEDAEKPFALVPSLHPYCTGDHPWGDSVTTMIPRRRARDHDSPQGSGQHARGARLGV